jgi:hypothetical protein
MPIGAVIGTVDSLFASFNSGSIRVAGNWYSCPAGAVPAMLTVAADARRAGTPVSLYFWKSSLQIIDIQSL